MLLLFIATIAAVNLCVGYAVGVYVGPLWRRPTLAWDGDDDLSLVDEPTPIPVARPMPRLSSRAAKQEAPVTESPLAEPPPVREEASAPPPPPPLPAEPAPMAVTRDMVAALKRQLKQVVVELQVSHEDPVVFELSVSRLQQANDDFSASTKEHLTPFLAELQDTQLADAIRQSLQKIEDTKAAIDAALDEALDASQRTGLVEHVTALREGAAELDELLAQASTLAPAPPTAREGLSPMDNLLARVGDQPGRVMAALSIAPGAGQPPWEAGVADRLRAQIGRFASEAAEGGEVACDPQDRLVFVVNASKASDACQRVEMLRQELEATEFIAEDGLYRAAVIGAVAESAAGEEPKRLLERLSEALRESERYDTNRTFHHDGKLPTPVMPSDTEAAPRKASI